MREENGATRVLPRSRHGLWPKLSGTSAQSDDPLGRCAPPLDIGDPNEPQPGEVHCVCAAGSCIVLHGDCWHGQRNNKTDGGRLALHLAFASSPDTRPTYDIRAALPSATLRALEAK